MEKYTKTLENQTLNDLLLETLVWINFRRRKLIPNNKTMLSPPKNMLFPREFLYR